MATGDIQNSYFYFKPRVQKIGKIYSQKPTDGSGDFTFSRATEATIINKDGLIETVGSNIPRLNYPMIDGVVSGCPSLLLEPQSTNLIPYSEAISNSSPKSGTFVDNFAISPDGTQNATKLTAINTDPYFYQSVAVGSGDYTISVYVKGIGSTIGKEFLLILGSGINSTPQTITGEWKRFTFSGTLSAGTTIRGLEIPNPAVSGDELLVWGLQLEQGSYATSYIPTSGSIGTRSAEQGIDGGAGTPIFSNTSAVWFIDLERIGIDAISSGSAIALRNSSFSQQIRLHFDQPSTNIRFRDGVNGFATISTITGMGANVRKKIALRIDGSTLSTFSNGSKIGSDYTAPNAFNLEEIDFSGIGLKIHDMRFYNTALTDAELAALTS